MDHFGTAMDTSYEESSEKLTIIDLPEELLEKILCHMTFADVLKMHDVNSLFRRISTNLLISHIPNVSKVTFENFSHADKCIASYLDDEVQSLRVIGFDCIVRFVRFFYPHITTLSVHFGDANKFMQKTIFKYIINRCRSFLTRLSIFHMNVRLRFNYVWFTSLEFIEFNSCYLGGTLCRMSILFPNVREIKLSGTCHAKKDDVKTLLRIYENLEYMKVSPTLMDSISYERLCILNSQAFLGYYS